VALCEARTETDDDPEYRGIGLEDSALADPSSNGSGVGVYSNLDWALAYQRTGLVLLPLWPGKKAPHASKQYPERALLGEGFRLAEVGECTEEWVKRCWGDGKSENGIGVVCGSRSRLLLIDVDVKNQGEFAWEAWRLERESQGLTLPEAPLVRTPSGGYHLWFRLPVGLEVRSWDGWLPGVDVLANGHWAAVPPTFVNDSGRAYEFLRSGATPEAPEWFLEQVSQRGHRSSRPAWATGGGVGSANEERFDWVKALNENIQPGEQQVTLFRAAASARARGWDDEKALEKLRRVVGNFVEDPQREPWTVEHVVEAWERVKREYADGDGVEIDEEDIPEYTPWSVGEPETEEEVIEVDVTGANERPRLRIIQGEGGGSEEEVSTGEAPSGGDDEVGGAGGVGLGLPPGGGWETPPSLGNTDEEHAREFHRLYGEQVLWVPELSWHSWVGTHWKPDIGHDVDNLLTRYGYRIEAYRDALRQQSEEDFATEITALGRRVDKLWNTRSMVGVKMKAESYAQEWGGTPLTAVDLDVQHNALNTADGTLEFAANGQVTVREHRPEDLITRCTTVAYRPDARSDLLDQYRWTFMPEDDHWEALWRLLGSCVLGGNEFRQIILLVGESTTGKSQIMQLVKKVLGGYAELGTPSMVRGNNEERARADLMKVMYSRLVFIEELGKHNDMHGDRVKDLTGGGEVTARNLFAKQYITRPVEFTIIVTTNSPPVISDSDNALLRRVKVVPFDRSVIMTEDTGIRQAMQNDQATQEAVLAELVHGAQRARERGVDDVPARFLDARAAAYGALTGGDDLGDFLNELKHRGFLVAEPTKSKCIMVRELHELYATSPGRSRDHGIQAIDARQFGRLVRMLGYETKNLNGGMRVLGYGLKAGLSSVREWLRM
jgi:putative DNA primase/helicase